jgi:uncharacterized protein YndB with AHSA1/START domain
MSSHGTYTTVGNRPAVRFERRLNHPVDAVWRAVTDPAELAHWFPAAIEVDELKPGARLRFTHADGAAPPSDGEILELEPLRRLAFTWGDDRLELALAPDGDDGCRLTFTHVLARRDQAARDAAGWHVCLDRLATALDGEAPRAPSAGPTSEWREHYAAYQQRGLPTGAPVPS